MPWLTPCCINRLSKHYSHLVECSFLGGKAAWILSGHLPTEKADYCMLMGMVKVKSEKKPGIKVVAVQKYNNLVSGDAVAAGME